MLPDSVPSDMDNTISLATAGGGKTTKLIERIKKIGDSKILIISFTKSSCNDIFIRSGVMAQTLHSFCYNFLPSYYNIEENIYRFTDIFLSSFFELSKLGRDKVNHLLESYFISKNYVSDLSQLSPKDQKLNLEFQELIKLIEEEKSRHNCLFFSDIISEFKQQLDQFLFDIHNQYDHIMIDEAQDLSEIQLNIVYQIITNIFFEDNKTFFIVGDVKQSIYNFQGSHPTYYLNFIERLKQKSIEQNKTLNIEVHNTTYRFGGEILNEINRKFTHHIGKEKSGFFHSYILSSINDLLEEVVLLIEYFLEIYPLNEIMIVYEKTTKVIELLQNQLGNHGFSIKIYGEQNKIVNALRDILGYIQTKQKWFVAKILQGPFFHLSEPHFYLLNKTLEDLTLYNSDFFHYLIKNQYNASKILKFLINRTIHSTFLDIEVLKYLYSISFNSVSFADFVLNIPNVFSISANGIKFSTVHSSKGLEAEVVIFIKTKERAKNSFINLNPFVFFTENTTSFTQNLVIKSQLSDVQNKNNLEYVALTRSKTYLYTFEIDFDGKKYL